MKDGGRYEGQKERAGQRMDGRHSQTTRQQGTFAEPSESRQTKGITAGGLLEHGGTGREIE